LFGKGLKSIHDKQEWPYVWDRMSMPAGKKGKQCRIVGKADGARKGQGIVKIQFRGEAITYDVQKKGLKKVG
jgi:hypothetical protein